MKKYTLIITFLAIATTTGFAQIGTPLAQYVGNQLIYNPGYAGVYDLFSVNLSVRKLWVGVPGSPSLISLNSHAPFQNQRHSLGFVFQREEWGPMIGNYSNMTYAHKFLLKNSFLNLGVQAGFMNGVTDWDKIEYVQDWDDPGLGEGRTSETRLDVNVGAYFQADKFHLGTSVKNLTRPKFDNIVIESTGEQWYSQKRMQFFFIGGYRFELDHDWELRAQFLTRYIKTLPTTVDLQLHAVYRSQYLLGVGYNTAQNAVSLSGSALLTKNLRVSYSYDLYFGKMRNFQKGSHEISINYFFTLWKGTKIAELPDRTKFYY